MGGPSVVASRHTPSEAATDTMTPSEVRVSQKSRHTFRLRASDVRIRRRLLEDLRGSASLRPGTTAESPTTAERKSEPRQECNHFYDIPIAAIALPASGRVSSFVPVGALCALPTVANRFAV